MDEVSYMSKNTDKDYQSLSVKVKKIKEMQSLPEDVILGLVNSKGKLRILNNGKLGSASQTK